MDKMNSSLTTGCGDSGVRTRSEEGFALIASLLTVFILTAMGLLVFTVTTQDVRMSSRTIGEKKAFSAAETGLHQMMQVFDPDNLQALQVSHVPIDSNNDPQTVYSISAASFHQRTRSPAAGGLFHGRGADLGTEPVLCLGRRDQHEVQQQPPD